MTITCDTKLSPHRETTELQFAFYRNGHNVQGFSLSNQYGVPSTQLEDSGNYTCEVQTPTGSVRKRSSMAHIHIQELFSYPQINVSSDQVTEGDHMTITCGTELRPHRETTELQFAFYRNGHNVQGFSLSNQYEVPSAQLEDSGNYTCEVQTPTGSVRKRSSMAHIHIQELFNNTQIKVSSDQVTEGDHMTITCDTKLSPHRETTELLFAFYRNGHNVQGFSSSNQYGVPSAQLEDSGNYTCEVQTPTGSVRKRSNVLYIHIQELFSTPQIKVRPNPAREGDHMIITCDTELSPHRETTELQFAFYRNGHNEQRFSLYNKYGVPSAQLEDSGNYTCEVQTPTGSVRKRSSMVHIHIQALLTKPQIILSSKPLAEGDEMTITCDPNLGNIRNSTELQFAFFKNGLIVQGFNDSSNYTVPSAQLEESGNYTCEVKKRSSVSQIQVEELFSSPQIKVRPDQVTEGDHMTITCDTKLNPRRATTELQFAFYRNGHNVQGFSLSNQYGVPSVQLEDSGNYICEVQTPTGSVRKRSTGVQMQLYGAARIYWIIIGLSLLSILLIGAALTYKYRHSLALPLLCNCLRHHKQGSDSSTALVRLPNEEMGGPEAENLRASEEFPEYGNLPLRAAATEEEDVCYSHINSGQLHRVFSSATYRPDDCSVIYCVVKPTEPWENTSAQVSVC
uniref:Ig-like domain-containing protein n=1 Tax=Xenopus tropicalis TaxID=8364 RepID=L7N330_XENTR